MRSYADRGVELLSLPVRSGKTACENAASQRLVGEIVVNTDASIRILPRSLKPLIAPFADPRVGLVSGRDISVNRGQSPANVGESGYVGYEMGIRDLETTTYGIVGASGCLYAIRIPLHRIPVPASLSRDFSAALKCEEHGYRAVSVSVRTEYQRKVRTITRGMETLIYKRTLLNPFRYGTFAWMLVSHKICRWLAPWAVVAGALGLALLAPTHPGTLLPLGAGALIVVVGGVGWLLGDGRALPRPVQVAAFALSVNVAAMHASIRALTGDKDPIWEPTRRESAAAR